MTHAKRIASKVATDLKRLQRFYHTPSDEMINQFEEEIALFLRHGYLKQVSYGFQRNGLWIEPSLHYEAKDLNGWNAIDEDPGRVRPGADVTGANFYSYMIYSDDWWNLSESERQSFNNELPFIRGSADVPGIDGYLSQDKTYSAGGKAIVRSIVKKY